MIVGAKWERLSAWLATFADEFPQVESRGRVLLGDPVEELLKASEEASLVVCGSRGQGFLRGSLFGSVGRAAARQATRPTAVVRPELADA